MMESKSSEKIDHVHEPSYTSTKLSMLTLRPSMPSPEEGPLRPPQTTVSVPFMWEEAPGKPRHCHTQSEPKKIDNSARTLELPPRLLFSEGKVSSNMEVPSPTTVLGGPYVTRAVSFTSSYRTPREYWNPNFGSTRWSGFRKINRDDAEGSFDFSCRSSYGTPDANKVKINRKGSLLSLSPPKERSHFWASIYENFKQMVPWRRGQGKQRKWASKFDTV